jgi:hypothetical protein
MFRFIYIDYRVFYIDKKQSLIQKQYHIVLNTLQK